MGLRVWRVGDWVGVKVSLRMEVLTPHPQYLPRRGEPPDAPDATFTSPDLTVFTGLDHLGLEVTGHPVKTQNAVQACRVVEPDDWCHRCGEQGVARGKRCSDSWRMCRSGGDRRCCWSRCVATGAPGEVMCGVRTPRRRRCRGRRSPGPGWRGHWLALG
ncbi:hypothetical protein BN11_4820023 [Nostocoides australiense Ben110]|uniref:Uncharacterized protein n=1 Tax=Nostocoides australiense Ben110 TaxID=1193182 RepID=W6K4D5_9MICO|nr:hypothetical protein BN11_4820023 [Tetrasphaera australiensis Ben110]